MNRGRHSDRALRFGAATGSALLGAAALAPAGDAEAKTLLVKSADASGPGSLAKLIRRANRTQRKDRIVFRSSLSGAIDLPGDLRVRNPLEIDGRRGGQRIEGAADGGSRVIFRRSGRAAINRLELDGVGVRSFETRLRIRESLLSGDGDGHGIYVNSSYAGGTKVVDSTIQGFGTNVDFGYPVGAIKRSTIRDSSEGPGVIQDSRGEGFSIVASTISGNAGGGVGVPYYGGASIQRSTISGNGEFGLYTGAGASVVESTITDNGGAGIAGSYGFIVQDSIIAGNNGPSSYPGSERLPPGAGADCSTFSTYESRGGNVFGDGSGCDSGPDDRVDVDAGLLPLDDNGGPTATHALGDTSPALGNGAGTAAKRDQRGVPRGSQRDSGAFELAFCGPNRVNVVGSNGRDRLQGSRGDDGILGLRGSDRLLGGFGADALCGSAGRDRLKGALGDDLLNGGRGKDVCRGGQGEDTARRCEREPGVEN